MSCYHPQLMVPVGLTDSGKPDYKMIPQSNWPCPPGEDMFQKVKSWNPGAIVVPCGKCIGCRLDYSRSWADRMMLELETAGSGIFVTLTYNNENAHWSQFCEDGTPMYATLDKRDCQLFMKRLRKKFDGKKVRFYLAGEYGERTLRPHYHAILFGLGLYDLPGLLPHGRNELGQQYYICPLLSETWSLGFVLVSDVSWKTCAYVARYVTKKLSGPWSIDYAVRNVIPEFSLMSRKPGLGAEYLEKHPDCLDYQSINLTTPEGGLKLSIPKYYLKKLELIDPERFAIMKAQRKEFAEDRMILKLQKTGLSYLDALEVEENKKLKSVKVLKRSKAE